MEGHEYNSIVLSLEKKNQLGGYFKETPKINFPMMI
ncbi:Uncharacterised protein [Bacteroides ovatus]|nr:hypothetical protein Bovatus_04754 [Bacteroides ovatus]CAG9891587.1 hypothetical protein BOVA713_778 [Bacteroides ovatus]SDY56666.1 hypothetical protein SAMN05444282_101442 [Bacteroides ovatus]SQA51252.1 Uncharacterised protein [Bacteroides ovatus]